MGYRIALAVDQKTNLTLIELRTITRMAWHALDKPKDGYPAYVYFGGLELLMALWPDQKPAAAKRTTLRALQGLQAKGYVKPLGIDTARGRFQRYEILL
jgi:hypothetical protein